MVAKIASKLQKPDGLVEIKKEDIPRVFAELPIESLQGMGVGRKLNPQLKALGFTTARHLAEAPLAQLTAHFGVMGHYLKNLGKGEDCTPVRKYDETDPAKSFGHSHTLPKDTWDLKIARAYLLMLAEKVGVRLREDHMEGRTVSLVVRYADFTTFSRQQTLKEPVRDGYGIYRAAETLFEKILPLKKAVRLLGVSIGNVSFDKGQGFLFDTMEKRQKLTDAVDRLNRKYGEFTLKPVSLLIAEKYGIDNRCGTIGRYFMKKK
jgi:DNA polymerase-4